ncbi:site-specific integrase [Hydrogenophaga sp.]|uniref:site-specific integrase n=1 Tax=Hydrogenophaga sp. TaxID=1904254 RepID=UPI003F6F6FC2
MASIQKRGDKYQVRIKHKLLPKPLFVTLDSEAAATTYADHIEQLLDRGIVPAELLEDSRRRIGRRLDDLVDAYRKSVSVAPSDHETLALLEREVGASRTSNISARWADEWVRTMKVRQHLAPGTVRKRVGALARVMDWHIRATLKDGDLQPANPLRMMPRGYSQYTPAEAAELAKVNKRPKNDNARDRRLDADEEARIRAALAGVKRDDRERGLQVDDAFVLLFDLVVNTGLRLSEAFKLRVDQVDHARGVLRVEGSKGERGRIKPRVVPLVPALRLILAQWCKDRVGLVFPFWSGAEDDIKRASNRLSARFAVLFAYAKVDGFTEHDLRHEATCRWITMRDKSGRWMWSEIEVCKIMGWSDPKMFLRYASLRGEDLADRMLG